MAFLVTDIIDGNTIEVAGWKWKEYNGTRVKITGYSFFWKRCSIFQLAKARLINLLSGKSVDLQNVSHAEKSTLANSDIIYCSVLLNGVDVSQYFPELKNTA